MNFKSAFIATPRVIGTRVSGSSVFGYSLTAQLTSRISA